MTRPLNVERPRTEVARDALQAGSGAQPVVLGDVRGRAWDLPLLRRENGGLRQAVRLLLDAPAGASSLRVEIAAGERVLAAATIPPGGREATLLVPEVTAPSELVLRLGDQRAPLRVRPQRHWRVFVIQQSHLDIGYTDPQDTVLRSQVGFLDAALELTAATRDWPEAARFRWNVESLWPLQRWLETRPRGRREAFLTLARQGAIEVCALPFNMHTEAYSIDELARQLDVADRLRHDHDLPIVTAMQTDVPGATVGLLELLAGAGVRYLSVAHNYAGRSVPYRTGGQRLTRPFRWKAPSGRELLVWYTDSPHGSAYIEGNLLGLAEGYERALDMLPNYLAALAARPYPYQGAESGWLSVPADVELTRPPYPFDLLHLRVNGEIADNAPPSPIPAQVVRRWNEEWTYPALRLATNREFFEAAEAEVGERLDTFGGDWTDWWADGIGSAARELAMNRRAQALAPSAATMHSVADALGGREPGWPVELERCYEAMALFDEHTWGAANPWADTLERADSGRLQWQRKSGFALDAHDRAEQLHDGAEARLGGLLGGAEPCVAVFNPSPWRRTDLVRVFVPAERLPGEGIELVDAERGERVPFEAVAQGHARFRPRGRFLRFVARDVPGLGYRRYLLREGREEARVEPASGVLESERYRLALDPAEGCVTSLVDRDLGRELVHAGSPFGFNQYVYDSYTSAPHFNHLSSRLGEIGGPWLLGRRTAATDAVVTEHVRTPIGQRLTARMVGEGASLLESTYELLDGVRRLDIRNRVHKLARPEKESVYFPFPFALEEPRVAWEITGGVDTGSSPRVPGSARHMRAIRHWLTLESDDVRVAWATRDAPLVQVGMLHLPYAPFPATFEAGERDRATVFSWAMNNIWDTNFPSQQGGEVELRYAVGSEAGGDARRLGMDVGAGLARPLTGVLCAPLDTPSLPDAGAFCQVEGGAVDVVTVGPSRDGHDLVLLLHSLDPEPVDLRLGFPLLPVGGSWTGSFLERDMRRLALENGQARLRIAPGEYLALALDLRS